MNHKSFVSFSFVQHQSRYDMRLSCKINFCLKFDRLYGNCGLPKTCRSGYELIEEWIKNFENFKEEFRNTVLIIIVHKQEQTLKINFLLVAVRSKCVPGDEVQWWLDQYCMDSKILSSEPTYTRLYFYKQKYEMLKMTFVLKLTQKITSVFCY